MSKIYNEWGEYTEEFKAYQEAYLSPFMRAVVDSFIAWLDEHDAPALDYKLIDMTLLAEIDLMTMSAWMEKIEKHELGEIEHE